MKPLFTFHFSLFTLLLALGLLTSCGSGGEKVQDYAQYVNLFVGTGGHGHTHPGALVPNGMIQPGPDTRIDGWDSCSGYYYEDTSINGFAHTRLSGTGCADFGDFLIMPTVGEQVTDPQDFSGQTVPFASEFSHQNEHAEPGYYSVVLDRYGVKAELTATKRAAIHRYTFPESEQSGFILDLDYSIQYQMNLDMKVEAVSDTEIRGSKLSLYWAPHQELFFYAKLSKPFTYTLLQDTVVDHKGDRQPRCKMLLQFPTAKDEQVLMKLAVSSVDMDGAKKNLEAEIKDWEFDEIKDNARAEWNNWLSKIEIDALSDEDKTIFYTAMYHASISPNLFIDVDGRYYGMDRQIHQGDVSKPLYTIFSLWDTFRALHPLLSIIDPQKNNEYIKSLMLKAKEGGMIPMWDVASNYTACMLGYHAASLMADAVTKGYADFDLEQAYRDCRHAAEYNPEGIVCPQWMVPYLMTQTKKYKNELGFVPWDKDNESVAKALEYAYDDWCISVLAHAVGDEEGEAKYAEFAQAYRLYFDPVTKFMRGRDINGKWREPFNPKHSNHRDQDYCEGNAWQWAWFVPHDVEGLVELMGGKEGFIEKLDALFTEDSTIEGENVSADISGLIGQYAHGNEPSHHIIHLYNYVDQPWKTQEKIDQVMKEQYRNDPDGLSGNEDCGQMSAWYIMNAMGFYQVCPGKPVYSIGRPWVNKATMHLPSGKDFTVIVNNNSRENKYIESIVLNGQKLEKPFFTHEDILGGGTLEITMNNEKHNDI